MLGEDMIKQIEINPDLFYNNEKFREWRSKARDRSFMTTAVVVPAILVGLNKGINGIGFVKSHPILSFAIIGTTFIGSFFTWHRILGYNN